jgi:hypothetical protein
MSYAWHCVQLQLGFLSVASGDVTKKKIAPLKLSCQHLLDYLHASGNLTQIGNPSNGNKSYLHTHQY